MLQINEMGGGRTAPAGSVPDPAPAKPACSCCGARKGRRQGFESRQASGGQGWGMQMDGDGPAACLPIPKHPWS